MIPEIHIEDYTYELPSERIAKYPLAERDSSKLLVYKDGVATEDSFRNLPEYIPTKSTMVFNDTKVVPARLFFRKQSGAHIEIFCLEPYKPKEYNSNFDSRIKCSWRCVIGNAKRWKGETLLVDDAGDEELKKLQLKAKLISREDRTGIVSFEWEGGESFSRVLELCGRIPIPPYLNRETEEIDKERYQTLYAHIKGSVAAPTAGLHFTERVISVLKQKGVDMETICLHVGAGTFLPVKSSLIAEHPMHREPFVVSASFIEDLLARKQKVVAVGTTSVRTLESLYYVGVSCLEKGHPEDVSQWEPYTAQYTYSMEESLHAILKYLQDNNLTQLKVGTRIIIVPGFKFRLVDAMVTNFHQPKSTLLLLISAFVGGDWRTIYDYALSHDFRFLSYGDSSILFRAHDNDR